MSTSSRARIVVVGSVNVDVVIGCEHLPAAGETVVAMSIVRCSGGKGANQAVAAARLGADVAFIGRVGHDGVHLLDELRSQGIDVSRVVLDSETSNGVAHIHVDKHGEKTISVWPGANGNLSIDDVDAAASMIEGADVLIAQLESPMSVVAHALGRARSAGVMTVLDTAPASPLHDTMLALVDVLRMNRVEASIVSGFDCRGGESMRQAAQSLRSRGAGTIAMQSDSGNQITSADEAFFVPHFDVPCLDATGAGDAFTAGLATMLGAGAKLLEAARFASGAAALATTSPGARDGLPSREEVEALLAR